MHICMHARANFGAGVRQTFSQGEQEHSIAFGRFLVLVLLAAADSYYTDLFFYKCSRPPQSIRSSPLHLPPSLYNDPLIPFFLFFFFLFNYKNYSTIKDELKTSLVGTVLEYPLPI